MTTALPAGWRIEEMPSQGPNGQMLVQVHDANAPERVEGKRITVTLRTEGDTTRVEEYTVLGDRWEGNRTPAEQGAVLERYEQVREEFGDPLQVVAVSVRRALEAATYAADEREQLRARVAQLEATLYDVLISFHERAHVGIPCIRTGWVREEHWREWHQVLGRR